MRLHSRSTQRLPVTRLSVIVFVSIFMCIVIFSTNSSVWNAAAAGDSWEITYQINRSQVPDLYYNELTVQIQVDGASSVNVQVDGSLTNSTYDSATGIVQFTTNGSNVTLLVDGAEDANMPPTVSKAALLDDRKWAWSHGFDDNVNIKPSIAAFNARGWQATVFMITSDIEETRNEPWIVDKPDLLNYLAEGWGVGSHGYASDCSDYNTSDQLTALDILADIVDDSARPDYLITSFAVPCFRSEYTPVIMGIIQSGSRDLQFYESGNDYLRMVDTAHVRPHGSNSLPTYTANNITAKGLELNGPLGRDYRIENSADISQVKAQFDWMANNANSGRHFWYNTLAHGFHEDTVSEAITHVYNNYGPNGTNEAWVAPSDEIYSYILVRDSSQVTMTSIKKNGIPWSPATVSPSPSSTNTHVPTETATSTQTHTPSPNPTDTPNPTNTLVPTQTPTATSTQADPPTETPTQTFIPIVTQTSTATSTRVNTPIPTRKPTNTPLPTQTTAPTNTPLPTRTQTPQPTNTSSPIPTKTALPDPTQTSTAIPQQTSCNLLQNGSFENGTLHWEKHGTLTLRSDAYHLEQALHVAKGWAGQKVTIPAGENLLLTGQFRSPKIIGWTGVGIDFFNSAGQKIGESALQLAGNSQYQPFSLETETLSQTTELRFWVNSASGGEIIVDDLALERVGCDSPLPTLTSTASPTMNVTPPASETPAPVSTPLNPTVTASATATLATATLLPSPSPADPVSEASYSLFFPMTIFN